MTIYIKDWLHNILELFESSQDKKDDIRTLEFTSPLPIRFTLRVLPNKEHMLLIGMELAHDFTYEEKHEYRKALFSLSSLHRHKSVEYTPYFSQGTDKDKNLDALAASFPKELFEPTRIEEILNTLWNICAESKIMVKNKAVNEKASSLVEEPSKKDESWVRI